MYPVSSGFPEGYHLENLHDSTPKVRNSYGKIKGVYCCEDLSQICSKSNLTAELCLDRFAHSPADYSCSNSSAAVNASYECVITADCAGGIKGSQTSSIAVRYGNADNLCSSEGYLKVGGC